MMETVVGWREWVSLPDLNVPGIKAKIDTGAKTSALHAFELVPFEKDGKEHIRFSLHPVRRTRSIIRVCEAPVLEKRIVRDSGGHSEERYVIESQILLGSVAMNAQITLTNRDDMLFPMLLGRTAMQSNDLIVDPRKSYRHGKMQPKKLYGL